MSAVPENVPSYDPKPVEAAAQAPRLSDELEQLREATARAAEQGLQTFDQHLFALVEGKRIGLAEALKFADSRTDLSLRFKLERGFGADDSERKVLRDG